MDQKRKLFNSGEELFGLPPREYPELRKTEKELVFFDLLYGLYERVTTAINGWLDTKWHAINLQTMAKSIQDFFREFDSLPKQCSEWDVFRIVQTKLQELKQALPVLETLRTDAIAPRHWGEVFKMTGKHPVADVTDMCVRDLLVPDIMARATDIMELALAAAQESDMERKIKAITDMWQEQNLSFSPFKQRGAITLKVSSTAEILELLDDSQTRLAAMLASRHVSVFRDMLQSWQAKLSAIAETLELWLRV